jgi:signal recognition particle GTPase
MESNIQITNNSTLFNDFEIKLGNHMLSVTSQLIEHIFRKEVSDDIDAELVNDILISVKKINECIKREKLINEVYAKSIYAILSLMDKLQTHIYSQKSLDDKSKKSFIITSILIDEILESVKSQKLIEEKEGKSNSIRSILISKLREYLKYQERNHGIDENLMNIISYINEGSIDIMPFLIGKLNTYAEREGCLENVNSILILINEFEYVENKKPVNYIGEASTEFRSPLFIKLDDRIKNLERLTNWVKD